VKDKKANGSPLRLRRTMSSSRGVRPVKTTLYIQMEYCERHTLRDLIRKGFSDDQDHLWRLFRQILEGLAHIHSNGIIHRDLKPDNVFIDVTNCPRIGDFGLATSGQYHLADRAAAITHADGDMTRSIGTALYVAPELRSGVGGNYNEKVDMYSLGIIFFEMCHPLRTAMERDQVIRKLREKQHTLPADFQASDKALQGSIILSLISHRPSERPSSAELLRNGKLPLQIEDDSIKEAVKTLADPSSAYHQKMMSALFSQTVNRQVKDVSWDMGAASGAHAMKDSDVVLQTAVKDRLVAIFRKHGAVESRRPLLFPRSSHYENQNVVQLLDPSGTLVQLPFDLTLPHARVIARQSQVSEKSYCFADVFRDTYTGGAPRTNGEADFDIVSYDTKDLALKEAEVIKVMDEIIDDFPSLASSQMCFHLNHSDLLEIIMDFCRINVPQRPAVKEILSKLNIQQWTWQKIRNDLRAPTVGVSSTSLDDLAKFDWRDTPEKAFAKIRATFEGTDYLDKTHAVFAHLSMVINYLKRFNIRRKVFISPLSSFNEKFYSGMYRCDYGFMQSNICRQEEHYFNACMTPRSEMSSQLAGDTTVSSKSFEQMPSQACMVCSK
jgi:eukaryotic translation initiation factor 2-alpha kinase 4